MIDEMVRMTGTDLQTIDAIAVAGGPGSFTGLRIGSATAKGLGLALNKPLIHVPTVDALAYQVYGCGDIICPIMDARRSQVYTGMYTFSSRGVPAGFLRGKNGAAEAHLHTDEAKMTEPVFQVMKMQMAISVEELIRRLNNYNRPVVLLGDGVPVYQKTISEGLKVPYSFAPSYMNRQRAAAVGALGIQYYRAGKYETAAEHQPDYLRVSQAERERAEREKNQPVIVRAMKAEDAAAVAEMEHQIFADAWSERGVLASAANPQTICLAAEKGGKQIGYLIAYIAADDAEIARIAVVKEQRRSGVGAALLARLEDSCQEHAVNRILLDVRKSNASARSFYAKQGFQEDGTRLQFYENPGEDAVLMSKSL